MGILRDDEVLKVGKILSSELFIGPFVFDRNFGHLAWPWIAMSRQNQHV